MSQWASGDSLTPSTLNRKLSSAATSGGFSTNTLQPESGGSIVLQGILRVTGTSLITVGTASAPGLAPDSEVSLGLYRSAASHLALSYGTLVSNVSATNLRGSTASFGGVATVVGTVNLPVAGASLINFLTGSSERWYAGLNLGSYGADQFVVQDRQNLNTGMFVLQAGAGFSVGQAAQHNRSATSGFIYVSSTTDAPTGTPGTMTGKIPLFYDTGNNALWAYNGSWRSVTFV